MAWPMIPKLNTSQNSPQRKKTFRGEDVTDQVDQWEASEALHRLYYRANLGLISQALGGLYAVVHDDGFGGTKVSACDDKRKRAQYIRRLDFDIKKGSYVPSGRVPEGIPLQYSDREIMKALGLRP